MGPKERRGTVLSPMEEAAIVALRVHARLPLDDVFVALKDVILQSTRSSLHRCLQRSRPFPLARCYFVNYEYRDRKSNYDPTSPSSS